MGSHNGNDNPKLDDLAHAMGRGCCSMDSLLNVVFLVLALITANVHRFQLCT